MCGIAGCIKAGLTEEESLALGRRMANSLSHRGPDGSGVWYGKGEDILVAHSRLAIIDLSHEASQPMMSRCKRHIVSYNGELYNYKELRDQLEAKQYSFQTESDTEVLLAAIIVWGIDKAIRMFCGMYAFAYVNMEKSELVLARDRLGEKPLYYGRLGGSFVFASELTALKEHPNWTGSLNEKAIWCYSWLNYVPAPLSIYSNIEKLEPGSYIRIALGQNGYKAIKTQYWCLEEVVSAEKENYENKMQAMEEFQALFNGVVQRQKLADVPVGLLLSGGIDSSIVASFLQKQSSSIVRTFTVSFDDKRYNEGSFGKSVSSKLGTNHTDVVISSQRALEIIPEIPRIYDEPFSDSSQIPTVLVCRIANEYVKVVLSGDGGDETFAGYNRYRLLPKLWNFLGRAPSPVRRGTGFSLRLLSKSIHQEVLSKFVYSAFGKQASVMSLDRLSNMATAKSEVELYFKAIGQGMVGCEHDGIGHCKKAIEERWGRLFKKHGFQKTMQYLDAVTYLPDDVLVKVDRASMSTGLEVRAPFLDHKLVEFSWKLPNEYKTHKGRSKVLLRDYLKANKLTEVADRPKAGFSVPLSDWLKGPLKDWATEFLEKPLMVEAGIVSKKNLSKYWEEHLNGKCNNANKIWNVVMFEAWMSGT